MFDCFLSHSFEELVQKKLGNRTFRKIERRLLTLYGLTVSECIADFTKIDAVMREILGSATDKLEKELTKQLFTISNKKTSLIILNDKNLSEKILLAYGDKDKKTILELLSNQSILLLDIQSITNIPQATGYRRAKELIDDGLLVESGYELTSDNKRVKTYTSLLSGFTINSINSQYNVQIRVKENFLESSMLCQII